MNLIRAMAEAVVGQLVSPQAVTASGNGSGVDISALEGSLVASLNIGVVSGTNPTLAVKLTESDTSGGTYTDVPNGGFAAIAAADASSCIKVAVDVQARKKFIRAEYVIGGTATPTFNIGVTYAGLKKYGP